MRKKSSSSNVKLLNNDKRLGGRCADKLSFRRTLVVGGGGARWAMEILGGSKRGVREDQWKT